MDDDRIVSPETAAIVERARDCLRATGMDQVVGVAVSEQHHARRPMVAITDETDDGHEIAALPAATVEAIMETGAATLATVARAVWTVRRDALETGRRQGRAVLQSELRSLIGAQ